MTRQHENSGNIQSDRERRADPMSRRDFLNVARVHGGNVALLVAVSGVAGGACLREAVAQTVDAERARRSAASHVMVTAVDGLFDRYPEGSVSRETIYTSGALLLKQAIERHSAGKIYVDVKPGGSLGYQALAKVQQGVIQACNATTQNCASLVPTWNVLDFPFVVGNSENMAKIFYSREINDTLRKKSEERGLINLGGTPFLRWLHFGQSVTKPVVAPQDVKGLKIRVTNSRLELASLQILGANPTPIGAGEIVTAMTQGVIDGYNIGPHYTVDANLTEAVKQAVDSEFMPNTDCYWVNTRWMRGLPPALQGAVMESAFELQQHLISQAPIIYQRQVGAVSNSPPNSAFRKAGIRIHQLTEAERAVWRDAMSPTRNPVLIELREQFGRSEFETVQRVVKNGSSSASRWWT